MKQDPAVLYTWSAEYVIAHALWRESNGKPPMLSYRGEQDPVKALELAKKMAEDKNFDDFLIQRVFYDSVMTLNGFCFPLKQKWGPVPKPGDIIRNYGGVYNSRGYDINGLSYFYQTEEQYRKNIAAKVRRLKKAKMKKFEQEKPLLDARYKALPEYFRRYIRTRRREDNYFRWQSESYVLSHCELAVKIVTAVRKKIHTEFGKNVVTKNAVNGIVSSRSAVSQILDFMIWPHSNLPDQVLEFERKTLEEKKAMIPSHNWGINSHMDDQGEQNAYRYALTFKRPKKK